MIIMFNALISANVLMEMSSGGMNLHCHCEARIYIVIARRGAPKQSHKEGNFSLLLELNVRKS